jgi:hypothetical protein
MKIEAPRTSRRGGATPWPYPKGEGEHSREGEDSRDEERKEKREKNERY